MILLFECTIERVQLISQVLHCALILPNFLLKSLLIASLFFLLLRQFDLHLLQILFGVVSTVWVRQLFRLDFVLLVNYLFPFLLLNELPHFATLIFQ